MFMGVVGRPIAARKFDGRLHMERVSEIKVVQKLTAHANFCDDIIVNCQLKQGACRDFHSGDMTVEELQDALQET